jgi:hypothetical protein
MFFFSFGAINADEILEPAAEDTRQQSASMWAGWSISAGTRVRDIDAAFSSSPQTARAYWRDHAPMKRGGGHTGLYDRQGNINYQDGDIAYANPFSNPVTAGGPLDPDSGDGTAYFGADHGDQIDRDADGNGSITFHATRYVYFTELSTTTMDADDDCATAAPYIAARRLVASLEDNIHLSLLVQYAFSEHEMDSGWRETARQDIYEQRVDYTFEYAIDPLSATLPDTPFSASPANNVYVVYDADAYRTYYAETDLAPNDPNLDVTFWELLQLGNPDLELPDDPSRKSRTDEDVVATLIAEELSEFEIRLHELFLALEISTDVHDRVTFSLACGPTLNLLDWDFTHTTHWSLAGSGARQETIVAENSDQDLVIGAGGQLAVKLTLGEERRYFMEASGGYFWVDELKVGAGLGQAEIDLSSYSAGAGIGINL